MFLMLKFKVVKFKFYFDFKIKLWSKFIYFINKINIK